MIQAGAGGASLEANEVYLVFTGVDYRHIVKKTNCT